MKRRHVLVAGLGWMFGVLLAQAQPGAGKPNLLVIDSASTPPNFPYAVTVSVTVENRGQAASEAGTLDLTLTPRGTGRPKSRPGDLTMWDPVVSSQELPALPPGQKTTLTFSTPYQARNSFKSMRGSFKANNIEATGGDVTVGVTTRLR
jgi:hypothetical protein